jgi:hypothetical protein
MLSVGDRSVRVVDGQRKHLIHRSSQVVDRGTLSRASGSSVPGGVRVDPFLEYFSIRSQENVVVECLHIEGEFKN